MATTAAQIIKNIGDFSKALNGSEIVKEAKASIKEMILASEVSLEERERMMTAYIQQLSLGILNSATELAKSLPVLEQDLEKATWEKHIARAQLIKKYGFKDATLESLGTSSGDGMIDMQTAGFYKDQIYKLNKTLAEMSAMLAQNDIETPEWITDILKLFAEIMSDGRVDLLVTGTGEDKVTTVTYDHDAVKPNGLGA